MLRRNNAMNLKTNKTNKNQIKLKLIFRLAQIIYIFYFLERYLLFSFTNFFLAFNLFGLLIRHFNLITLLDFRIIELQTINLNS